jgi:hypothetical protein
MHSHYVKLNKNNMVIMIREFFAFMIISKMYVNDSKHGNLTVVIR